MKEREGEWQEREGMGGQGRGGGEEMELVLKVVLKIILHCVSCFIIFQTLICIEEKCRMCLVARWGRLT